MAAAPKTDPMPDIVVRDLPVEIRTGMSREQLQAIRKAVSRQTSKRRHFIDVRILIPLIFTQLYVVFLIGRDTRKETEDVMDDRRSEGGKIVLRAWSVILATVVVFTGLVVLYIVKTRAGINLFDGHLRDWLPFFD
ncbi:MAG: hypothetical protein IH944_03140 [Armatimonadetes bacterium]|nr:hypothetical protein [Armatimonadota bacterium]